MHLLQLLITRLECASLNEINEAIFAHPDVGLIEALRRSLGDDRGAVILSKVSEELHIPLVDEGELRCAEEVLNGEPAELKTLLGKYRALPLALTEADNQRKTKIALADPLDQDAIQAFTAFYKTPLVVVMAAEQQIKRAVASVVSMLAVQGRNEFKTQDNRGTYAAVQAVEDPEVRKAIQQVTATAIKHGAEAVSISLTQPFTSAVFAFEDSHQSTVDISVSTTAFLACLLRRGQVVERKAGRLEALCRVDFKSSGVCCTVEVAGGKGSETTAAHAWSSLKISDFSIERADDPNFWLGLSEQNSLELRRIFRNPTGAVIIVAPREEAGETAVRALSQSYPDVTFGGTVADFRAERDMLEQAKCGRVLFSWRGRDIEDLLENLCRVEPEERDSLQGIFCYYQLPRVCDCCSQPYELPESEAEQLPSGVILLDQNFRRGEGCAVCSNLRFLGTTGISAVLDLSGEIGRRLISCGSASELKTVLDEMNFRYCWDDAVCSAAAGKTSLEFALSLLPEKQKAATTETVKKQQTVKTPAAPRKQDFSFSEPGQPIRGRDVFGVHGRIKNVKAGIDENFELRDRIAAPGSGGERQSAGQPLVLIIDDDADQRAILRKLFELEGYCVEVAADGIDGIVSANRLLPQLIVVDFMMPDLDGRETIRRLKKGAQTAEIPVVALTAYANPDVEYGLLKAGADDFCSKSVPKKVLLKRVERLLSGVR